MQLRRRFWVEVALAVASGIFFVLTLFWKDWIEIVFGVDPDQHSGSLEWLIVGLLLAATLATTGLARREWQRRPAQVES